ncbi:MAG: hypothetical protein IT458_06035 [Planctomycetes bacterium]|nr:hypothetical protein [Planctomycetota bacterium]
MATVLITAGPTREHLDEVRFLANGSSGRMGYALAAAARDAGHHVVLISGPTELTPPEGVDLVRVISAEDLLQAVLKALPHADAAFAVAAVADWRPKERLAGKPPKAARSLTLELVPTPDVLAEMGRRKEGRVLVGFALESGTVDEALARGRAKLEAKNLDLIVVNRVAAIGAEETEAWLVFADGHVRTLPRMSKSDLAAVIVRAAHVPEGRHR